jgi:hypothetical protein
MSNVLHPPCDAAAAQARAETGQTGHPRFVIATTILASSLAFVDGSVVNVGLPAIGASFRADADHLQWVVNAYLLPLSALLLLVLQLQLLELPLRAAFFVVRMLRISLVMPSPE